MSQNGMTIALALIVAFLMGGAVLMIAGILEKNSRDKVYLNGMYRSYRLSESAMNEVLGQLAIDPSAFLKAGFSDTRTRVGEGRYNVNVFRRDFGDVQDGYYIVTTATSTVAGQKFVSRLHTYAQISNVGDYFAAVNDNLVITRGRNIANGKIYGRSLTFSNTGSGVTTLRSAEFVETCNPSTSTWASSGINATHHILEPMNGPPKSLKFPLLFPQLLDSDIQFYAQKAHLNPNTYVGLHKKCDFRAEDPINDPDNNGTADIFPPGYVGAVDYRDGYAVGVPPPVPTGSGTGNPSGSPTGAPSAVPSGSPPSTNFNHTFTNEDHVYFCNGDMFVEGLIHGQVLFVATGDIYITGNLQSSTEPNFPGEGANHVSSSTAHQGIFMTRKNVHIDDTFVPYGMVPPVPVTEYVEGLFIAPNGTMAAQAYGDPVLGGTNEIHDNISLAFNGAMILGKNPNLSSVFANATFSYMDSLRTNPPPDLPSLSNIVYSFEETFGLQK
jgi:hypothetical protein